MIIDLILDRKDGDKYRPEVFYREVFMYGEIGFGITSAMDDGEEIDVKTELCYYVAQNGYSLDICNYIKSVNWL